MKLYLIWIFLVVALPRCTNPGMVSTADPISVVGQQEACPGEIRQVMQIRGEGDEHLLFVTARDSFELPLPEPYDLSGFSVDRMEAVGQDFFLLVEYGTRIYWNKEFKFTCRDEEYRLASITSSHFDKRNPEGEVSRDTVRVEELVALRSFQLMDFIE